MGRIVTHTEEIAPIVDREVQDQRSKIEEATCRMDSCKSSLGSSTTNGLVSLFVDDINQAPFPQLHGSTTTVYDRGKGGYASKGKLQSPNLQKNGKISKSGAVGP